MKTIRTRGFFNPHTLSKAQRIFKAYLIHEGYKADKYILTYTLFKEPELFVAGWKIAIERTEFLNQSRIHYSIIV